jgi:hypothetical protein
MMNGLAVSTVRITMGRIARRVDVPNVDVAAVDASDDAVIGAADVAGAVVQVVAVGVGTGGYAEHGVANSEMATTIRGRAPMVIERRPDVVVVISSSGYPGRSPTGGVGPEPAVGMVVVPATVMGGDVGEGLVAYPHVAIHGHVAPRSLAVRHVIPYA